MGRILFINIAFILGILRISKIDTCTMAYITPSTDTVPALMIASTRGAEPEATGRQARTLQRNTKLETIGLCAEQDILLAQTAPCTTDADPVSGFRINTFNPDALDIAIMTGPPFCSCSRILSVLCSIFPRTRFILMIMATIVEGILLELEFR